MFKVSHHLSLLFYPPVNRDQITPLHECTLQGRVSLTQLDLDQGFAHTVQDIFPSLVRSYAWYHVALCIQPQFLKLELLGKVFKHMEAFQTEFSFNSSQRERQMFLSACYLRCYFHNYN